MRLQSIRHDLLTEQKQQQLFHLCLWENDKNILMNTVLLENTLHITIFIISDLLKFR